MDESVRKYLAEIGRKGGKSGTGTQWRSEVCRHAAIVRWRAYRERKRRLKQREQAKRDLQRVAQGHGAVGLVEDLAAEQLNKIDEAIEANEHAQRDSTNEDERTVETGTVPAQF